MNKKKFITGLSVNALLLFILHFFNVQRFMRGTLFDFFLSALIAAILNLLIFLLIGTVGWGVARLILRKKRYISWRFVALWTASVLLALQVFYFFFGLR